MEKPLNQAPKPATRIRRLKERARYKPGEIYPILDSAYICHVGFCVDEVPYIIPMAFGREENTLILHGSSKARIGKALTLGQTVCISVTHLDGLVLAKSQFHHSMNYRSVVLFGRCREITDKKDKQGALLKVVRHLVPGRENDARPANDGELKATFLVEFQIEQATAKIRTGPPSDFPEDRGLPVWAGVIPLTLEKGPAKPGPDTSGDFPVPPYLKNLQPPHQKEQKP